MDEIGELLPRGWITQKKLGVAFVVTGPSGAGKSSVIAALLQRDRALRFSVSATTRPRRPEEEHGRDYYFVSEAEFNQLVESGTLLEWTVYQGHRYGTPRSEVEDKLAEGLDLVLSVEVNGALAIARARLPHPVVLIFLVPPSREELRRRIRARGTESEEALRERLAIAESELERIPEFHYLVVNDRLWNAVAQVQAVIAAERCRIVQWSG